MITYNAFFAMIACCVMFTILKINKLLNIYIKKEVCVQEVYIVFVYKLVKNYNIKACYIVTEMFILYTLYNIVPLPCYFIVFFLNTKKSKYHHYT